MKSFLMKAFPVVIIGMTIYSLGEIVYILISYEDMLTALPLKTMLMFAIALRGISILILTLVYILIRRHYKK